MTAKPKTEGKILKRTWRKPQDLRTVHLTPRNSSSVTKPEPLRVLCKEQWRRRNCFVECTGHLTCMVSMASLIWLSRSNSGSLLSMAQRIQHPMNTRSHSRASSLTREVGTIIISSSKSKLKQQKSLPKRKRIETIANAYLPSSSRKHPLSKKDTPKQPKGNLVPSQGPPMMPSLPSSPFIHTFDERFGGENCLEDTHSDLVCLELKDQAHITRHFNLNLHHQPRDEPSYEPLNPIERYLKEGATERYSLFCIQSQDRTQSGEARRPSYAGNVDSIPGGLVGNGIWRYSCAEE